MRLRALLLATLALAGCTTNYLYVARGELGGGAAPLPAALYWHKDEGRLWYGRRYEQVDSDLVLLVCQRPPKPFDLGDGPHLRLFGKGGDRLRARLAADGAVAPLPAPRPLPDGGTCGAILLDGRPTDTSRLRVGTRPVVILLCDNPARPDRYPPVGAYPFAAVSRTETDDARSRPDPCLPP